MSAPDPSALLSRSRETAIRRDAQGRWFDGDDPITHPLLVRCFDGWIERAPDGRLCLKNDINWAYVAIEGPPYFVRSVTLERPSIDAVTLRLSGERTERLDPRTLTQAADGALECSVASGVRARFDTHAVMQLESLLVETPTGPAFLSEHGFIPRPLAGE